MDKDFNWNEMNCNVFGMLAFLSWRILNICVMLSESEVNYVMCLRDGVLSTGSNEKEIVGAFVNLKGDHWVVVF